jgi:hypothetical protein
MCLNIKGMQEEALFTSSWRTPASSSSWAGGTSTAPTGASAVPADSSIDDPVTGGSAPTSRVDSMAATSARGDGGAGSHLSEVVCSPSLSFSSRTSSPMPAEERDLAAHTVGTPRCTDQGAPAA